MFAVRILQRLLRDSRGATAIEYGLICGLIVIALIAALDSLTNQNTGVWGVFTHKVLTATG